jgi:hypothetical protein
MRMLGKDSHWWKEEEREWASQDQSGNWWIYKKTKEPTPMKIRNKRRNGQTSVRFAAEHYAIITLACALGISLVLNIIILIALTS